MKYGFTLIELLVSIVIIAILITAGLPTYNSIVVNNRASAVSNSLVGTLRLAQSEAIRTRENIRVCPSNANQTACIATNPLPTTWSNGWLVVSQTTPGVYTTIVRSYAPFSGDSGITLSHPITAEFTALGYPVATPTTPAQLTFTINPAGCTGQNARSVVIEISGLVTINELTCV